MADDPTPPAGDEIDLEELIGGVLEKRGFTVDRASKLDALDSLGDNLGKKVEELFRTYPGAGGTGGGTPAPFDKAGFLSEVGRMIDSKLSGLTPSGGGTTETKKVPLFQRVLGVKGS